MKKHTPGPWIYGIGDTDDLGVCLGVGLDTEPNWTPVCVLSKLCNATKEDEANARLIAAAPDLLNACTGLLKALEDDCRDSNRWGELMLEAAVAIAKATGNPAPEAKPCP